MRIALLAWTVEADPEATRAAYRSISGGASHECGCLPCRNFSSARPEYYPEALSSLLEQVGAEPCKEAVVRLVAPLEGGMYLYSGCYPFCGELLAGRPYRGFPFLREEVDVFERLAPGAHVALRPWFAPEGVWTGTRCVRVEFLVVLPWVLEESGAPAMSLSRGPDRVSS